MRQVDGPRAECVSDHRRLGRCSTRSAYRTGGSPTAASWRRAQPINAVVYSPGLSQRWRKTPLAVVDGRQRLYHQTDRVRKNGVLALLPALRLLLGAGCPSALSIGDVMALACALDTSASLPGSGGAPCRVVVRPPRATKGPSPRGQPLELPVVAASLLSRPSPQPEIPAEAHQAAPQEQQRARLRNELHYFLRFLLRTGR